MWCTLIRRFLPLKEVEACAPTCFPSLHDAKTEDKVPQCVDHSSSNSISSPPEEVADGLSSEAFPVAVLSKQHGASVHPTLFDRLQYMVDWLVRVSGSKAFFCLVQICLLTWVFLGIPYSQTALWPIVISNAQAIFSYILDTMLMRQQLTDFGAGLVDVAQLRSRNASKRRMLEALQFQPSTFYETLHPHLTTTDDERDTADTGIPVPSRFARTITRIVLVTGHIFSVGAFWVAMLVWFAFGPSTGWSNLWQLDINSATSAWMVFLFSLLAVTREEDAACHKAVLDHIIQIDHQIELHLRTLTNDATPNASHLIVLPRPDAIQRVINVYAQIVGGLVGLVILVVAFVVWGAVGPLMQFNDNWWLLIGTYAGLIGMNDGFVLRNVQQRLNNLHLGEIDLLLQEDTMLYEKLRKHIGAGESLPVQGEQSISITQRVSDWVCMVTAHRWSVVAGAASIVGLVIGATAMKWSLTGQLLCNIPPMIMESFFTQVLITAHIAAETRRSRNLLRIDSVRRKMLAALQQFHP